MTNSVWELNQNFFFLDYGLNFGIFFLRKKNIYKVDLYEFIKSWRRDAKVADLRGKGTKSWTKGDCVLMGGYQEKIFEL